MVLSLALRWRTGTRGIGPPESGGRTTQAALPKILPNQPFSAAKNRLVTFSDGTGSAGGAEGPADESAGRAPTAGASSWVDDAVRASSASALLTKTATSWFATSVMSPVRPNCAIAPDS